MLGSLLDPGDPPAKDSTRVTIVHLRAWHCEGTSPPEKSPGHRSSPVAPEAYIGDASNRFPHIPGKQSTGNKPCRNTRVWASAIWVITVDVTSFVLTVWGCPGKFGWHNYFFKSDITRMHQHTSVFSLCQFIRCSTKQYQAPRCAKLGGIALGRQNFIYI